MNRKETDPTHNLMIQAAHKQNKLTNHTEETANLSVKVSRRLRVHWLIEAKRQRTSLTAAIIEALTARFGEPD